MRLLPAPLLVVTDRHQAPRPLPEVVAGLIEAGARWVWLRDRDLAPATRRSLAQDLAALLAGTPGAVLTVGADVDLAAELGSGAVQVAPGAVAAARARLGAAALVGASAHSVADLVIAKAAGADYATLSPVFASGSKPGYGPALGLGGLAAAAGTGLPVLALGGVSADTAGACLAAGASGVAVMGAAMRADRQGALALLAACGPAPPGSGGRPGH